MSKQYVGPIQPRVGRDRDGQVLVPDRTEAQCERLNVSCLTDFNGQEPRPASPQGTGGSRRTES
jgi:hypothetical protein